MPTRPLGPAPLVTDEAPDHDLESLLGRLTIVLQQPVDFARTDTETTLVNVRLLTAAASYFNILRSSRDRLQSEANDRCFLPIMEWSLRRRKGSGWPLTRR